MLSLSPEICKRIVQNALFWHDVLSLCLTCKAFQKEAEIRIYNQLQFADPRRAALACTTVIENERLALHVKSFWFTQQNDRQRSADLGRHFWSLIQKALISMCNLELLVLCDRSFANGWILDNPAIQFRLNEAKLWFVWNPYLTRFLERQTTLQTLHFTDRLDDITHRIAPGALPNLRIFDGTFMVAMQLLSCPFVHLQVIIDEDPVRVSALLRHLANFRRTLSSLSLLDIPEEWATRFLGGVSVALPDLKHLGIFPYPTLNVSHPYPSYDGAKRLKRQRHEFFKHLMQMHYLKSIELDIVKWQPSPVVPVGQRVLAAELQTYCPSIQLVTFWMGNSRVRWSYAMNTGQWQHKTETQLHPQYSNTWCLF